MKKARKKGIIIVEVLVVMLLLGALTVVLLPNLETYVDKTRFSDVVRAANALKSSVSLCIYKKGSVSAECDGGAEGIPSNVASNYGGHVASVSVADGAITATSTSALGSKTFVLTPTLTADGHITWASSGTCVEAGLCTGNATDESSTTDTGTTGTGITYTAFQQATLDNCSAGHSGQHCSYNENFNECRCSSIYDCDDKYSQKGILQDFFPVGFWRDRCVLIP